MKRISIRHSLTLTAVISFAVSSSSQTNSWTKSTSGSWHEPFWSLGVLPGANQSHIMVTNAGWKAVAIDRVTARDFPDSLNIPRLTVASPTNTVNTLMLNFAGTQSPLRVAGDFDLGSNSVLLALSSALEVGGSFLIDGTVNHDNASSVSASILHVGDSSPGNYHFNNGAVRVGNLIVGEGTTGRFNQSSATSLSVSNRLTVGRGDPGTFREGNGFFDMAAGILTAPTIQIGEQNGRLGPAGADGTFVQSGGSNFAGGLLLGWPESDASSGNNYTYILRDGLLVTSNTFVYGGEGHFVQTGGLHRVEGPLAVAGFYGRSFTPFDARYTLSGGGVTARSLNIDFGTLSQSAGTNEISGDVIIGLKTAFGPRSFYQLSGGTLGTSNTFVIDSNHGSFSQSGGTHAVRDLLEIVGSSRRFDPGYTLAAGELIAKSIRVSTNANFNQTGGSASATQISIPKGAYNLDGGDVLAANLFVGEGQTGAVRQAAGTFVVTNRMVLGLGDQRNHFKGTGEFELSGGTLSAPVLQLGTVSGYPTSPGGEGIFVQSGGSNFSAGLVVGTWDSFDRNESAYSLNSGILLTSNTLVHPDSGFRQSGGLHWVSGPLTVRGNVSRLSPRSAAYIISNGVVRSHSIDVDLASFQQLGGTNEVLRDLRLEQAPIGQTEYVLTDGVLTTANTIVGPSRLDAFVQRGGTHTIAGTLDLTSQTLFYGSGFTSMNYRLQGGRLDVRDIRLGSNSAFAHVGGNITHRGTLALAGGRWHSGFGEHQLGALILNSAQTNSSLWLDDNATTIRFGRSAGSAWEPLGILVIHNWRGSTNGNGPHRIIFGADETGLTSQQLAQIRFRNPMGLVAGDYSATILSTGEILPLDPTGRGPSITYQQSPGQLRLEWPSGYTLQTATNIVGPFEDVHTNSPYALDTTAEPRRFFRFRQ